MTRDREGDTINQGGASKPTREERDRAGIAGDATEKGEDPSPDDRGEPSSFDDGPAIDLDSAHDRAS